MPALFRFLAAAAIIYLGVVVFSMPRTSELSLFYSVPLGSITLPIPYGVFTMPKLWGAALVILGLWELQKTLLGNTE
jgi:hypothetical protein